MKKLLRPIALALPILVLLSGCLALDVGGGTKNQTVNATVGQQLIDLQRAKDAGAISDAEYQAQKARLLGK